MSYLLLFLMNLLGLYVQQFGHRQGGEQKSHCFYFITISAFLYLYFFNSFAVYVAAFELGFSASTILYLDIAFGEDKSALEQVSCRIVMHKYRRSVLYAIIMCNAIVDLRNQIP